MMIVVNMQGAPGAGKSTAAAYIFSRLKMLGYNVELSSEFIKDKIYEGCYQTAKNQAYIFGCQYHKLSRLEDKVDIVVTDSPLINSILYNDNPVLGEHFTQTILDVFNSYDNINYLITRARPYSTNGRVHTEEESDAIHLQLIEFLKEHKIKYTEKKGDISDYEEIVEEIDDYIKKKRGIDQ